MTQEEGIPFALFGSLSQDGVVIKRLVLLNNLNS